LEKSTAMKLLLAIAATVLLCAACAQGGSAPPSADSSGITMYGTIDEGISYHSK
jgi:opacity protein-like surface antigen